MMIFFLFCYKPLTNLTGAQCQAGVGRRGVLRSDADDLLTRAIFDEVHDIHKNRTKKAPRRMTYIKDAEDVKLKVNNSPDHSPPLLSPPHTATTDHHRR